PQTVTISADETLETLQQKIERASGFRATVTMSSAAGVEQLRIVPATKQSAITLSDGPAGRDALSALGLKPGRMADPPDPTQPSSRLLSGLDLNQSLNLDTPDDVANVVTVLKQALSTVRVAYENLAAPPKPKNANNSASGPVPKYLTDQIANY